MNAKKTILLIDDEDLVIRSLEKFMDRQGFNVVIARNGLEAIEKIKSQHIDLIVTDIRMPHINGIETIVKIREILKIQGKPKIPEICITGYAEEGVNKKAEQLGVADYLYKPFDLRDFIESIKKHLD